LLGGGFLRATLLLLVAAATAVSVAAATIHCTAFLLPTRAAAAAAAAKVDNHPAVMMISSARMGLLRSAAASAASSPAAVCAAVAGSASRSPLLSAQFFSTTTARPVAIRGGANGNGSFPSTTKLDMSRSNTASSFSSSSMNNINSSGSNSNSNNDSIESKHDALSLPPSFLRAQHGTDVQGAIEALRHADAVCFDVDSTVITEEGIDVLAEYLGQGREVAALTAAAMEGGMAFQDALAARLQLLRPSRAQIEACLRERPFRLTPHVETVIETLRARNTDVYLVSGGFRIMIEPVAARLGICPASRIYANTLLFDADSETGLYAGFDASEPTSRDMGKPAALKTILERNPTYRIVVMVGDGATDAQAKPPATAFVGFGGVVVRDKVRNAADWFVTDFADVVAVLQQRGVEQRQQPK
jgi:phosphoserine phosphatase